MIILEIHYDEIMNLFFYFKGRLKWFDQIVQILFLAVKHFGCTFANPKEGEG